MLVSECEDYSSHYFIVQGLKRSGSDGSGALGALGSTNSFIKAASMNKPSFILRIASKRATVGLIIAVSCGQDFFLYFNHKQQKYQPVREIKRWLLKRKRGGGGQKRTCWDSEIQKCCWGEEEGGHRKVRSCEWELGTTGKIRWSAAVCPLFPSLSGRTKTLVPLRPGTCARTRALRLCWHSYVSVGDRAGCHCCSRKRRPPWYCAYF